MLVHIKTQCAKIKKVKPLSRAHQKYFTEHRITLKRYFVLRYDALKRFITSIHVSFRVIS